MNARELHDLYVESPSMLVVSDEDRVIILRALDLLARTEESTDELVRELRDQADEERQFEYPERAKLLDMAAAAIVAPKAERDELKHDINCHIVLIDKLKAHAEAMAVQIEDHEQDGNCLWTSRHAYRTDFPKDPP